MLLRELKRLKQNSTAEWMIMGDFNLIYNEQDKNNGRVNMRLMLRF